MEAAVHLADAYRMPEPGQSGFRVSGPWMDGQATRGIVDPGPLADLEDPELVASLVELFFADATAQVRRLDEALEAGDFGRVRSLAHRLQGGAATVGALTVSRLCQAVCEAARMRWTAEASALAGRLPEALRDARSELEALLAPGVR